MKSNKNNYGYLINIYNVVNNYLSSKILQEEDDIIEIIISFCSIIEKIIKIQIYKKNPILVYQINNIENNINNVMAIINRKNVNTKTISLRDALKRYLLLFKTFSDDDKIIIENIYDIRNDFIHGLTPDNEIISDKKDILKKIGTIWPKVSKEMKSIFGESLIKSKKPKIMYSAEDLKNFFKEEVRKKVKQPYYDTLGSINIGLSQMSINNYNQLKCPRCKSYFLCLDDGNINNFLYPKAYMSFPTISQHSLYNSFTTGLYKCSNCGLELTQKEYDISKELF